MHDGAAHGQTFFSTWLESISHSQAPVSLPTSQQAQAHQGTSYPHLINQQVGTFSIKQAEILDHSGGFLRIMTATTTGRPLRPRRTPRRVVDDESDEEDEEDQRTASSEEDSDEEDEWKPDESKKAGKRGKRRQSDSDSDAASHTSEPSKHRKRRATTPKKHADTETYDETDHRPSYDQGVEDEVERAKLQQEAQEAWEQVRAKKQQGKSVPSSSAQPTQKQPPAPSSSTLSSWLGLPPIPWPTSPESSRIFDRESLFIGFAYPLETSSASSITPILNHLTSVVHPSLPSHIFPSAFSHLDPKRRGSSHDMQAYRVLELKRGRNGLGGPNDFGLEEKCDDDGERWAGEKILKTMKEMGAVDMLVIVSRWYGGTNLGPVRFEHIVNCARETIRVHLAQETLKPLKKQLVELDERLSALKAQLNMPSTQSQSGQYSTLEDAEKAQRLVNAKQKQIDILQKRLDAGTGIGGVEATKSSGGPASQHTAATSTAIPDEPAAEPPALQDAAAAQVEPPPSSPSTEPRTADLLEGWDDLS